MFFPVDRAAAPDGPLPALPRRAPARTASANLRYQEAQLHWQLPRSFDRAVKAAQWYDLQLETRMTRA